MNLHLLGGRRFILAVGSGAVTSILCAFGTIGEATYATVVLGTVGAFITGNVVSEIKGRPDARRDDA